jgi:hypothetical protein
MPKAKPKKFFQTHAKASAALAGLAAIQSNVSASLRKD